MEEILRGVFFSSSSLAPHELGVDDGCVEVHHGVGQQLGALDPPALAGDVLEDVVEVLSKTGIP